MYNRNLLRLSDNTARPNRIQEAIQEHLSVVQNTLNLLRDENVGVESESDQEFRRRVQDGLMIARDGIHRVISQIHHP